MEWTDEHDVLMLREMVRGGSRRGCTRLLLYFNTNKPHSFFVCRIPVVLENRRSSRGGGGVRTPCTFPLDPPLMVVSDVGRSALSMRNSALHSAESSMLSRLNGSYCW